MGDNTFNATAGESGDRIAGARVNFGGEETSEKINIFTRKRFCVRAQQV